VGFGARVWRREKAGPARRPLRRADVALQVADPALEHAGLHQFEGPDDARQHVVEVVGEAAGQLPDGLHLL
jgi:hypothetical protein